MAGMDRSFLDGAALREMLDQAIALEPAMGPVAHCALAAGLRRRRRHGSPASPCALGRGGRDGRHHSDADQGPRGRAGHRDGPGTVYVADNPNGPGSGHVTAISTVTGKVTAVIKVGTLTDMMAVTPNGKTIYVVYDQIPGTVVPISTATNTAGRPIKVGYQPLAIAITPNGKIAYVFDEKSRLTPIETATNKAGKPITIPPVPAGTGSPPRLQ